MNTKTTIKEILNALFYMRSVSYKILKYSGRKVGDYSEVTD
jgi:hypothetical protein